MDQGGLDHVDDNKIGICLCVLAIHRPIFSMDQDPRVRLSLAGLSEGIRASQANRLDRESVMQLDILSDGRFPQASKM